MKILITCSPMLGMIDRFLPALEADGNEVICPEFTQTLSEQELIEILPECDGWIIGDDPATERVLEAGTGGNLKAAVKWGVGTDNVDFKACEKLGLKIDNTPGMFGPEVADLAMGYIIALARDTFLIDREVRKGRWPKPTGISLQGKIVGIVGFGDIGRCMAKRAEVYDLKIICWDPYRDSSPDNVSFHVWPEQAEICDFLVFACALTEETRYLFDYPVLKIVKPGLRLVNVSRGPLIREQALIDGLEKKIIYSAALDVFENEPLPKHSPLLKYPQCILGSHNASNTEEAVIRASNKALELLNSMLDKS